MQIKDINNKLVHCSLKLLDESYIDAMVEIEENIVEDLSNKSFYAKSTKEDFKNIINNYNNKVIGLVNNKNELIAMGVYVAFLDFKENYGYDLDVPIENLKYVGNIESTLVRKEYRGNGIQKKICIELERYAKNDEIKILGATVAPDNKFSLNNFLNLGYKIYNRKIKYGSFDRYILKKELI